MYTLSRTKAFIFAVLIIGGLALASVVEASPISSRAALQAMLGGPGTLETFESYTILAGADVLDCGSLNSGAVCNGQGPGLVGPGLNFTWGSGTGQWDSAGYFAAPSKEILSGSGQPLGIDFGVSVDAFGVDLRAFSGYGDTATMTVFGTDDTTVVGLNVFSLPSSGVPIFAGWDNISGIGRVTLTQSDHVWSPIIDNLEFGTSSGTPAPVPEPSTILLLASGLAGIIGYGWRRKKAE